MQIIVAHEGSPHNVLHLFSRNHLSRCREVMLSYLTVATSTVIERFVFDMFNYNIYL